MAGKWDLGENSLDGLWKEMLRRESEPSRFSQFLPKSKPLSRSERLKRKFLDRLARLPIAWDVLRGRHECD